MHRHSRLAVLPLLIVQVTLSANAQADESVRVFILAGQSNMVGAGQVVANPDRNEGKGSLEWLTRNPSTSARFQHLIDDDHE